MTVYLGKDALPLADYQVSAGDALAKDYAARQARRVETLRSNAMWAMRWARLNGIGVAIFGLLAIAICYGWLWFPGSTENAWGAFYFAAAHGVAAYFSVREWRLERAAALKASWGGP